MRRWMTSETLWLVAIFTFEHLAIGLMATLMAANHCSR